jgi:hypothetical protein
MNAGRPEPATTRTPPGPPDALAPQAAHVTRPACACPTGNAPATLPRDAVKNGLTLPGNSGTAEGTISKNKMIKHQKYGRASLPSSASASCTTPAPPPSRNRRQNQEPGQR